MKKQFRGLSLAWLGALLAGLALDAGATSTVYRAYSFSQAQREVQSSGIPKAEVSGVGSITRPIALVYDEGCHDVILIGEADPAKEPLSLDDAVVAMRAVLKHGTVPLVSIDRTPNTGRSGAQLVRFDGGIENTRFGRDLLESDVLLKKMGLGLLPGVGPGAKSYAQMAAEQWRASKSDLALMTRFWFLPSERSQVATNRGIAFIDHLSVSVSNEVVGSSQSLSNTPPGDEIAMRFSDDINGQMEDLARRYRAIGRLDPLFRVTGLMQVLGDWKKAYGEKLLGMDFWLTGYQVRSELTADRVDLLASAPVKRAADGAQLTIDGGIDLKMLLTEWKEGSSTALRQLVILARPATNSLVWTVPLDAEPTSTLLFTLANAAARNGAARDSASVEAMTMRQEIRFPDGHTFTPVALRPVSVSAAPVGNISFVRQAADSKQGGTPRYSFIPESWPVGKEASSSRFEMSRFLSSAVSSSISGVQGRNMPGRPLLNSEHYSADLFRNPLGGWDPRNTDFHAPKALESLGVARETPKDHLVSICERPSVAMTAVINAGTAQPGDLIIHNTGKGVPSDGFVPHVRMYLDPVKYHSAIGELHVTGPNNNQHGKIVFGDISDGVYHNQQSYSVVNSDIPVRYQNVVMHMRDLPESVKSDIRYSVQQAVASDAMVQKDVGPYGIRALNYGKGDLNCETYLVRKYDDVLTAKGIQVLRYQGPAALFRDVQHLDPRDSALTDGALADWTGHWGGSRGNPWRAASVLAKVDPPNLDRLLFQARQQLNISVDLQNSRFACSSASSLSQNLEMQKPDICGNGYAKELLQQRLLKDGIGAKCRPANSFDSFGTPASRVNLMGLSSSELADKYADVRQSHDISRSVTPRDLSFNPTPYRPPELNSLRDLSFNRTLFEPNVKGVLLQDAAQVEGGTVGTGELGLVFQNSDGQVDFSKLRRFATALWAAYLSVEGPGISIDPKGKKENTQHVRYIGCVRSTDLGRIMRETDYLMKRWAIGTHRPDIEGFLTTDDISGKTGNWVIGRPSRFWLLPQGLTFKKAGGMLVLSGGRMTVQTEYLEDNPKRDKNPENERFANWFTDNYQQISERYPIYQELFEYAQLVGLCTYLKEQKMPLLWFLLRNREMILTEKAIDQVPALSKRSDYRWFVNISGGVELEATKAVRDRSNITEDARLIETMKGANAAAKAQPGSERQWSFTQDRTNYTMSQAKVLSLSGTRASGDTVQTDFVDFQEYREGDGANMWKLITPGLELVRHYKPERNSTAQFGPGWHLAVPFELTGGNRAAFEAGMAPRRLELHNVLSGEQEAFELKRITNNGVARLVYAPTEKGGFIENVTNVNGIWQLTDRLGAILRFDSEGYLTQLDLRPETTVPVKIGDRVTKRRIPGYSVKYEYRAGAGAGGRGRWLDKVVHGLTAASLEWDDASGTPRIGAIRVTRSGGSSELVRYEYGADGRLSAVQTRGGATRIQYHDNGMRVAASAK